MSIMTVGQAIVKFLDNQYISLDGVETKFVDGVFTIFGHGIVVGLGQALDENPGGLRVYQGRNEQGMAHVATGFARQHNRRKIIACASSIGPGAANMVTAAATATVNRIPLLLLPGDTFAVRQPDPVLQQIEQENCPSVTTNDAFRPVCKFWDRITRPEQLMATLSQAFRVLTDPAETGAVCVALSQDVEGESYDFPDYFFEKRIHRIRRPAPCREDLAENLDLAGVRDLLDQLGYANSALTQARKGKDVAEMVERSFVPNQVGSRYCDFCGSLLSGLDYEILADGRERCAACSRTAVKNLDEFVALHDAVLRNMKVFFGIRINAPVHVRMVNSKRLHKMLGQSFVPTGNADGRILGVAIKDRKGYTILIENGAPRLQSTMTMVHEMTHIWQYLNWNAKGIQTTYGSEINLAVYEGMAKWVEIQYTYLLGETAAAKREEIITRCRDDEYGQGFRMYLEKYPLAITGSASGASPFDNPAQPL